MKSRPNLTGRSITEGARKDARIPAQPRYRPRVYIFVKEPRPGRVKTRLAAGIGTAPAARWFRRSALRLIRRIAADPRWETVLAVAPDRAGRESRVWPTGIQRVPQGGGDLGARMGRVLRNAPPGPALIIGADIPGIRTEDIAAAFRALGRAEAVVGPAADGGYWLIGLARGRQKAPAGLFHSVRWSTANALEDSVATLGGGRVTRVRTLRDVDTADDLTPGEVW